MIAKKWDKPEDFINREFSWLEFNGRVLYEAGEKSNPLLERFKFLSIVTSNLEEFFMVRVAILKKQSESGLGETGGLTPAQQLAEIRARVLKMLQRQYAILGEKLAPMLAKEGVSVLLTMEQLALHREALGPMFAAEILPLLTPLSVGPTHPFPTLVSGRLYLAVGLEPDEGNRFVEKSRLSFVEVPAGNSRRFVPLNGGAAYAPVENIIRLFIQSLFGGYRVTSAHVVRITRDADFSLQEDGAIDLMKELETTIRRMHRRSVVKVEYEKGTPAAILGEIAKKNLVGDGDLYEIDGVLNLKDVFEIFEKTDREDLKFPPLAPVYPADFKGRDIFELISDGDRVLFHPYHSYAPVVELLNRAADDPKVLAIKQTLYRTSSDSEIIRALIRAAEKGKYVSVVDELKARFDEERNIEFARRLEDAGAHVTYGVAGLKTHAKALIIVRREPTGIKRYIHLGTGNYNETTARLYTDFSLFTSDERFGEDISSFFNLLTGFSLPSEWHRAAVAPMDLRRRFLDLVRRETANAEKGVKARIIAKMNSLSDYEMINELYRASCAGVKIRLIVRGICCLVPGAKDMSENIAVESIVGRFLEHPRVFYFHNAGEKEYYLSSADWMIRNLDRRIELLFPVTDPAAQGLIDRILDMQFDDTANKWTLNPDNTYSMEKESVKSSKQYNSFDEIYRFISALEEGKKKKAPHRIKPVKSPEE